MLGRRFGKFRGGIDLPGDKDATLDAAIAACPPLARLRVPLAPAEGPPARAIVQAGQTVRRGQRIAQAGDERQVDVFAPLSGRVASITEALLPAHPGGWRRSPAVELTDLGEPEAPASLSAEYEWQAADGASLRARISEGGLLAPTDPAGGSPAMPLSRWLDSARSAQADTLIANVMENTPFVTADHRLLAERGEEVMRGLAILARAIGTDQVMLAVDHRRTKSYRAAAGTSRLHGVQAIALAHKYPIGAEAILVQVLTRRRVPPGEGAMSVGVVVSDAATCWATFRWVACGEAAAGRVVTVAGPRVPRPANLLVPFGADAGEVLTAVGAPEEPPQVHGPAMTGRLLVPGAVVSSQTSALLGLAPVEGGPPTPCIRCGWCTDNCPARLNVAGLNDDFELGRADRAARHGAMACVRCGICSYVCPARLPLAERLRLLQQAIRRRRAPVSAGAAP